MACEFMTKEESKELGERVFGKHPMMDSCDEKAKTHPHFTLLAKDNFSVELVRRWIELAQKYGTPQAKIDEAFAVLEGMMKWREENPSLVKVPD